MVAPALFRALDALLPTQEHAALLRASLATGVPAREAWKAVANNGRSLPELFRTDHGDFRRLGPLLAWNLRRNDIEEVDPALLTVLRTSLLREELRSELYRDILAEVIDVLTAAGISFIVVAGADLGASAYPSPALRHAHDIDLLIDRGHVDHAADALANVGYRRVRTEDEVAELRHGRELPVRLNTGLFNLTCHPSDYAALYEESRTQTIGATSAQVLSREDALALVLGRAAYNPNRFNLQWACDAWMIASHGPLRTDRVLETLARARLLPSSSVFARFLYELGAPLSRDIPDSLQSAAMTTSSFDRDLALHALRRSTRGGFHSALQRMPSSRVKLSALAWVLFPSPAYIRWAHNKSNTADVSATYVTRILKAARA